MKPLPAFLFLLVSACNRHEPAPAALPQGGPEEAVVTPVDHLAPNELLEGDVKAFGLTLPRGMRIDAAFADVVFASGSAPIDGVAQYVRTHVREGKMISPSWAEPTRTTFDHVRVPAMPDKVFVIQVQPKRGMASVVEITMRDVTPGPAAHLPDENARWAAAGLKPNGQPLDPSRIQ